MTKIKEFAVNRFVRFIRTRERYRSRREGTGSGMTRAERDPIIEKYRFCNVRRNDDRVTKWVHKFYLDKWRAHDHLWFALVAARLFNNEETLEEIRYSLLPFVPARIKEKLHARRDAGLKNFNAAYVVSTNGRAMDKVDYIVDCVLTPMYEERKRMSAEIASAHSLDAVHKLLMQFQGMASFMAAQVVADLKYAQPNRWEDFNTFAASGPGSRRGLNRILGLPVDNPWAEQNFRAVLLDLRDRTNVQLQMDPITAQDIQNCLCEYDKYERVRLGEGVPKQLYKRSMNNVSG